MARIAILGAGFMGAALTVPATDNGHRVALWGTHLDDHLVAAVRAGRPHPKLGLVLPPAVEAFGAEELAKALAGTSGMLTSGNALPMASRPRRSSRSSATTGTVALSPRSCAPPRNPAGSG